MNKTKLTHRFARGLHLLVIAALLAGLALGLSPPPVAHAATFTVNDTGDAGDNNPGDGTCATAGGVCTLRAAIEEANALAGDDTINFAVTGTITLGGTQLTIDSNLTITGPGADQLTISGNDASRVFDINSGTVTISGLTITDGNAAGGGGIYNYVTGDLTLNNCTVSGNKATGAGGGIYNYYGDLTLNNCTVSGNKATGVGGGIYNFYGDLTLNNCTVSGNTAGGDGGGIRNYYYSDVTLNNCTVSGNEANDNGGGICDYGNTDFKNTIIANNTATNQGPDCYGSPDSYGYNLVEDTSDCTINEVDNTGTDIKNQDPNLGPLQDNGGPTFTHALQPGSPAIDAAIDCTLVDGTTPVTEDQRGELRAADGDCDGTANCDIGAYEAQDADCDGVWDERDNCPNDYNPDQTDSDGDGIGDVCDEPPVPVGGIVVPVNKLGLVAPWLGLVAVAGLAALTVALVKRHRSA
jgi:CSLREA domain-containing protein